MNLFIIKEEGENMLEKKVKMYKPEVEPVGIIQILHGMAEYKERYEYFI